MKPFLIIISVLQNILSEKHKNVTVQTLSVQNTYLFLGDDQYLALGRKVKEHRNFCIHSHKELRLAVETFDLGIWNDGFLTQKTSEEMRHAVLHHLRSQQTFVLVNSQEPRQRRAMRSTNSATMNDFSWGVSL